MTILLHFGMQKTASTSLQHSFSVKGNWSSYAYISSGRTQSNNIVRFSKEHPRPDFLREVDRRLGRKVAKSGAANLIISSENFPFLAKDAFLGMVKQLQATGHDVRLVGYVRKPKSFMESIFQERLKKRRMLPKDIAPLYPAYRQKFEKFEVARRTLGVGTEYWLFDPAGMPENCVVRDFCGRLGIPFDPADIRRENVGLSLPAIRFLQTLHTLAPPPEGTDPKEIRASTLRLAAALAETPGARFRLHSRIVAPVLEANRDDTAWMEDVMGTSLSENVAASDAGAVRTLRDLRSHDAAALDWLRRRVGMEPAAPGKPVPDLRTVASWLARLRDSIDGAA